MFIGNICVACYSNPKWCCIACNLSSFRTKNLFISPWNKNYISVLTTHWVIFYALVLQGQSESCSILLSDWTLWSGDYSKLPVNDQLQTETTRVVPDKIHRAVKRLCVCIAVWDYTVEMMDTFFVLDWSDGHVFSVDNLWQSQSNCPRDTTSMYLLSSLFVVLTSWIYPQVAERKCKLTSLIS